MPIMRGFYLVDTKTFERVSGPFDLNDVERVHRHAATYNLVYKTLGKCERVCIMREWQIIKQWEKELDSLF